MYPDYGTSLAARMIAPIRERMAAEAFIRNNNIIPPQQLPDEVLDRAQDTVADEGAVRELRDVRFTEVSFVNDPPDPNALVRWPAELEGDLPLRQGMTVLPADDEQPRRLGWQIEERIGMGVFNPRRISRMGLTSRPIIGFSAIAIAPLPDWVQVGAWARHRHRHEAIYQILDVDNHEVTLRSRATGMVVPWPRRQFFEVEFEQWFDPAPPRSRWERLLLD